MNMVKNTLNPSYRFTKVMSKTIASLREPLSEVKQLYEDAKLLFGWFQEIRAIFGDESLSRDAKVENLGLAYDGILATAKERDPTTNWEGCKSFLPSKKRSTVEIMGEWCRLWRSYLPGLFHYYSFPKAVKTNMDLEKAFSVEKQAIFSRVAKANVWRMVASRGEDYLRIKHCELDELASDIVLQYSEEVVKQLRAELSSDIKEITAMGRARSKRYERFDVDVFKYYQ